MLNLSILKVNFNGFTGVKLNESTDVCMMYDFRKRITLCRLMPVIFSTTIRTGERVHSPKPNSLFAFQTYTVADSKKNKIGLSF